MVFSIPGETVGEGGRERQKGWKKGERPLRFSKQLWKELASLF